MIRMVIVDDEPLALRGFSGLLPFEDLGFCVVGTYTSPVEARQRIQADPPDVVITDIRMPEMSGIALIESLTLAGVRCEYVLLSSYRDFEAAKAAIRLGVVRYIEKPFDREEVTHVLGALREKLLARNVPPAVNRHMPSTYENNPSLNSLLASTATYPYCYLLLSEAAYTPAGTDTKYAPLAVNGYAAACLLSQPVPLDALPEGTGASRNHPQFAGFAQMLDEADLSLRGWFVFSDNREAADIQQYLCGHVAETISLEDLAAQFFMSRARLCSLFKARTGFSPLSFQQHLRLHMSRWQLLHSDLRLREIADEAGYVDYSYFGRLFRRTFGVTPEEYRLRRGIC